MIVFDESEYLKSYVSDEILLAVLAISGLEEKDKLLYKSEKWYNKEGLVRPDEEENPTPCPDLMGHY